MHAGADYQLFQHRVGDSLLISIMNQPDSSAERVNALGAPVGLDRLGNIRRNKTPQDAKNGR